jgi:hypothetical protein
VIKTIDQYKQYYVVNEPTTFTYMEELENMIDGLVLRELAVAALHQAVINQSVISLGLLQKTSVLQPNNPRPRFKTLSGQYFDRRK